MNARLIFSLVIAVLAIIFALQNPQETLLYVGPAILDTTVAVAMIVAFVLGVLSGYLGSVISRFDRRAGTEDGEPTRPADDPNPPTRLPPAAAE
jgi:flagellar biosynthesis protein FliQ